MNDPVSSSCRADFCIVPAVKLAGGLAFIRCVCVSKFFQPDCLL